MGTRMTSDGEIVALLTNEQRARIIKAIGKMPYLGIAGYKRPETDKDVADLLEIFAETLQQVAARNEEKATELRRLQSTIEGGRAFLRLLQEES